MRDVFTASEFPPSLADHPVLIMLSIFALMFGSLLALQWGHRLVTDISDDHLPWRHPLTIERTIKLCIITGALANALPRLVQVMAWGKLTPGWREALSLQSWTVSILWATLFSVAWWLDRVAAPITSFQLRRYPPPASTISIPGGKSRGIVTLLVVLGIAFAVTYVRPAQPYEQNRAPVARP